MSAKDYQFQVLKLTAAFYDAYPKREYPEILEKRGRPYNCVSFELIDQIFVCIPYRTEIRHPYAYHFKNSARSVRHRSGFDYTKMVIIKNPAYISDTPAIVDRDEYIETVGSIVRIREEAIDFLESYINHVTGKHRLHPSEYNRRYHFSPLKYFHRELRIRLDESTSVF